MPDQPLTAPSWIVAGLDELRSVATKPHEREALRAGIVAFQASRFEEGIRRLWEDLGLKPSLDKWQKDWGNSSADSSIHPRVAAWEHVLKEHGVDINNSRVQRYGSGQVSLPSKYGACYLSHAEFMSAMLSLRNALVHSGPPRRNDLRRLDWLKSLHLPHSLISIDEDFLDETSYRMQIFDFSCFRARSLAF